MFSMNHFSIGEFARRAGVTVRTLRYYDRIGLLNPSAYTESKHRLYTQLDYARLQQILTLKFIGLSLDEIKSILTTDTTKMHSLLERQKQVLGQQVRQIQRIIQAIEQAQMMLDSDQTLDTEQFIHIIREISMNNRADWFGQFISDEERDKLAEASTKQSYTDQKRLAETWKALFADIQEHIDKDSDSPTVQALVTRWDAIVAQFAGDSPEIAHNLNDAYTQLDTLPGLGDAPQQLQAWLAEIRKAAQFIERARR